MFDNILYQSASSLLEADINNSRLPSSVLFSGPKASGKFSCALECARVLSCKEDGKWDCKCPSCMKHRGLVATNVLIAGPGDRILEIRAAKNTLLAQNASNSLHLPSARYLFLRAVRKLTARFSEVLWEGDDKISKFSPLVLSITENLESIDVGRPLPDDDKLSKILDEIEKDCEKLENSFLYDSIPVSQIRNFSTWAHISTNDKKKIIILENADSMADGARNALLKILEEPPEGLIFILTTSSRSAILPTILSRVRTYNFFERGVKQQQDVLSRVFHYIPSYTKEMPKSVELFLLSFLDISLETVQAQANTYVKSIARSKMPNVEIICSSLNGFKPRVLFLIFLRDIMESIRPLMTSASGLECASRIFDEIRQCSTNVSIYNQTPLCALEILARNLLQIDHYNTGVFKAALDYE